MQVIFVNFPRRFIVNDQIILDLENGERAAYATAITFILDIFWGYEKLIFSNEQTRDDLAEYLCLKINQASLPEQLISEALEMLFTHNYITQRIYDPDIDGLPNYSDTTEELLNEKILNRQ